MNYLNRLKSKDVLNQETLNKKSSFFKYTFIGLLHLMTINCFATGLLPNIVSYQRIFYVEDTPKFLITYIILLCIYILNIVGFLVFVNLNHVFKLKRTKYYIVLFYLFISALFAINTLLFVNLELTSTGYNVTFSLLTYILDLFFIFPIFYLGETVFSAAIFRKINMQNM